MCLNYHLEIPLRLKHSKKNEETFKKIFRCEIDSMF